MGCCKQCDEGKTCASKRASFGALGFFVPMEAVEKLDGKIRNLDTDIGRVTNQPPKDNAHLIEQATLLANWAPFKFGWKSWLADHYSTFSRTGPTPVTEFEDQQSQYNEFRRRTAELGTTSATVSEQDVSKAGGPGAEVTSTIKFVSVAIVAIVAAYAVSKAT